jgi:hypothetical protein
VISALASVSEQRVGDPMWRRNFELRSSFAVTRLCYC